MLDNGNVPDKYKISNTSLQFEDELAQAKRGLMAFLT